MRLKLSTYERKNPGILFLGITLGAMSSSYKPMPPLWRLCELFVLSDDHPSGLAWAVHKAGYKPGEQAGRLNAASNVYDVCIDGVLFKAHRIVYYLRTGQNPDDHAVTHHYSNKTKDNREQLIATRKPKQKKTQSLQEASW